MQDTIRNRADRANPNQDGGPFLVRAIIADNDIPVEPDVRDAIIFGEQNVVVDPFGRTVAVENIRAD